MNSVSPPTSGPRTAQRAGCSLTSLHIHANLGELCRARAALRSALEPIMGERSNLLILAVDEALANVIGHAASNLAGAHGAGASQDDIEFEIAVTGETVEVQITDAFAAFDPCGVAEIQLSERVRQRKRGGLGLGIMRRVLDEINYTRVDGRFNRLRLIKRLKP